MPKLLSVAVAAAVLALGAPAAAAQFVVTEVTYQHSATTTTDSHNRVAPSAMTPANWKAPVDYATAGKVHVRLEVFTKPSDAKTRYQICFEATPGYACTDQSPVYTTTGIHDWETSFPSFYQYDKVDWTKGVKKIALILKDERNGKPAPENVGEATSKLYMPTDLRVTVTVVEPGSTYVPPAPTVPDAGTPDASTPVADPPLDPEPETSEDAGRPAATTSPAENSDGGCSTTEASPRFPKLAIFALVLGVIRLVQWRRRTQNRSRS